MQFMTFPREVWAQIEGRWIRCVGLSNNGMVLLDDEGTQSILHHKLVLKSNLLWPGGAF